MVDGNHQVIVSIKDEGQGIDPSIIPRLFTKICDRIRERHRFRSVYIQSVIEAQGGRMWANYNREGWRKRGGRSDSRATFSFDLPVKPPRE